MSDKLTPFPDDEQARQESQGLPERGPRPGGDTDDGTWGANRHRHYRRSTGSWIAGAILLVVGVIFLLDNIGLQVPFLNNWWALFILIPAATSFGRGLSEIRASGGQINRASRSALFGGFILTLVALAFLFSLQWQLVWPILLILAGLGALITAMTAR